MVVYREFFDTMQEAIEGLFKYKSKNIQYIGCEDDIISTGHGYVAVIVKEGEVQDVLKYIELFAGIGGFRSALDKLGYECVFSSEIDKYATKSYQALYGHEPSGDITKIHVV